METATARSANYTTNSQVLYLAFELSNNKWKLGFTIGLGQKPRERVVLARDLPRVLEEIAKALKVMTRNRTDLESEETPPAPPC